MDSLPIRKERASDARSLLGRNGHLQCQVETDLLHQLQGGLRHGIGCGQQHGMGWMVVPAGDAVQHVPKQRGNRRFAVAEVCRKTGEAVAQHMRRDVARQITQPDDPCPHFPIADDRFA